jgi:CheY-like chemotaxis protein
MSQPVDSPVGKPATPKDHARVLVVEDQVDLRRMLATALEIDGHIVDEAGDAHEGLERLAAHRYDLVLTDYAMPGETGTWMLHEATRLGLMHDSVALIVTAQPGISEISEVEVITKPLDLDNFLDQVRRLLLSSSTRREPESVRRSDVSPTHRMELVLYVSSASPTSMQARENLQQLLARFDESQIKFSVCDLVDEPLAGEEDRVAFTPTLVRRYPAPRVWILGNLRSPSIVADLLRASGVDDRDPTS